MPTREKYRDLSEEQRERMRESARIWYRANRDKRLEKQREWREANLELKRKIMRESAARRRAEHPEITRAIQRKVRENESPERRQERLAKIREWHKAHRVEMREYCRKWAAEHPGVKARWRERHPEKARAADIQKSEQQREWHANHPEEASEYYRERRANNLEKARANGAVGGRKRRARLAATAGHHTVADIESLYEMQDGCCAACRKPFPATGKNRFTVDHIIPLKPRNGGVPGSNGPENLQLLCKTCNSSKSNLDHAEWIGRHRVGKVPVR